VARLLMKRYGQRASRLKSSDALQALLHRLRIAHYDWEKVTAADRLDVVWVLWEGTTPPAEHPHFLRGFLEWVEASQRRLQATRIAASWTAAFDPALKSIHVVAIWLARQVAWLPTPWPRLAEEFDIFSIDKSPVALAESFLASTETQGEFFERLQLPTGGASSGLVLEILAAATTIVAHRLVQEPWLADRLCDLSLEGTEFRPAAIRARAPRRGAAVRSAVAETLLLQWQRQAPPTAVRAQISAFLLCHYGDVRVSSEHWRELRAPTGAIMHRWLTEQTITDYFRLVSRAKTLDPTRLAERQAFWMRHLDGIDDAWLLTSARNAAFFGTNQPAHGTLGGCRPDRSALLLCVSGLTILESSHEENESVWLPGNAHAPSLYRRADQPYWMAALSRSPDFSSAYNQKDNDTWQERLAQFVARQCGAKATA
jgi:hypothetical protein